MPGDVTLVEPGRDAPITLEAGANGEVPGYGDLVGIVGESSRGTHVSFPPAAGTAVGHLVGEPVDIPEDATFAEGDIVGEGIIKLRHAIDWLPYDEAGGWDQSATDPTTTAPTAGDLAVGTTDGGVVQYADATHESPLGPVWTTLARAEGTASKLAVVRVR